LTGDSKQLDLSSLALHLVVVLLTADHTFQTSTANPAYPYPTNNVPGKPSNDPSDFTNCRELLDERVQVRWKIVNDSVEILLSARMREDQYVAFGLSGEDSR